MKGKFCTHRPATFCQENYCEECYLSTNVASRQPKPTIPLPPVTIMDNITTRNGQDGITNGYKQGREGRGIGD